MQTVKKFTSFEDLKSSENSTIEDKKATARKKDLEDIEQLKKIRGKD